MELFSVVITGVFGVVRCGAPIPKSAPKVILLSREVYTESSATLQSTERIEEARRIGRRGPSGWPAAEQQGVAAFMNKGKDMFLALTCSGKPVTADSAAEALAD